MRLPKSVLMLVAKTQTNSPRFFASIIHMATSKPGKKKKKPTPEQLAEKAAKEAKELELSRLPLTRTDGVRAAISGCGYSWSLESATPTYPTTGPAQGNLRGAFFNASASLAIFVLPLQYA
ncbi:MAG: hypothetical protein QM234_06550 [Acidobacteriota bacterium]|nr:hypothetical protein [Acidobacteriota bacterium]